MLVTIGIVALAAVGLANASYFVAVEQRWVRPDPAWLPPVCRMDEATCARVIDTRYARVLGVSNAGLGLLWYLALLASAGLGLVGSEPWCWALVAVAAATVVLGGSLVWALLVRLKTPCPLCFLGHGVNLSLLGLLVWACGGPPA